MKSRFISKLKAVNSFLIQNLRTKADIIALILIAVAITLPSISPLSSGDKVNLNDDFLYFASLHEAVRKDILEYHTFPTRSIWFGGGYPILGDPEDPTLNPMTLITIVFGSIMGIKIITFIALLIGGLSSYLLARYILGYTKWGSLFSGLVFGLSLFVPLRIYSGNINDVYVALLPLCLLLIGLACRGRKVALLILPFVFYIMISDGKHTALMAFLYIGILCLFDVIPLFNTFGTNNFKKINIKPLKVFILALTVTFFIGMLRILPVWELVQTQGGFGTQFLWYKTKIYGPEYISAYTFQQLWQYLIGYTVNFVTIGLLPVLLALSVFCIFPIKAFPWGVTLSLFVWLALAYNAPVDLFKLLWQMPIFNTISNPWKYFTFQIVFTFAIVAGQFFWLLTKLRPKWLEHIVAIALIILSVWFLYPKFCEIQENTYTYDIAAEFLVKQNEFYNIKGKDLSRFRVKPLNSITYTNIIRNVGTIDWMAVIKAAENAVPKYFVDAEGRYISNPQYRGEAYFADSKNPAKAIIKPNSITAQVNLPKPDTLIINQNYHRDWHTDHGKIFEKNGLIALQLDEPGSYEVTLRYISRSFFTGLIISILSLIILIAICWSYKTRRLTKWSQNTSVPLRQMSRFILWLID
jgi:hypothetical protein